MWVENSTGLIMRGQGKLRRFPGVAHIFYDRSDRPMMPVTTVKVGLIVEREPSDVSRIWVENAGGRGHWLEESGRARKLPGWADTSLQIVPRSRWRR